MKTNRIFNKLFEKIEGNLSIGMIQKSIVQKFLYVPEQMSTAFLFAESRDQIPVGRVKISNQNSLVKVSEMISNNGRGTVFIDMKESDIRIRENPEPVPFPALLA